MTNYEFWLFVVFGLWILPTVVWRVYRAWYYVFRATEDFVPNRNADEDHEVKLAFWPVWVLIIAFCWPLMWCVKQIRQRRFSRGR